MTNKGITVVCEHELREVIGLDAESIAAVQAAFDWAAQGRTYSPPIMHIAVAEHRGDVDIKSAYIKGEEHFAVKVAARWTSSPGWWRWCRGREST